MKKVLRKNFPVILGCILLIIGTSVFTFGVSFAFIQETGAVPWKSAIGGGCLGFSFVLYYSAWCLIKGES